MALDVTNSYGKGGALKTVLPREGIDIGALPNFWGDMRQILQRIPRRPVASAAAQGQALRSYAPPPPPSQQVVPTEARKPALTGAANPMYQDLYGTQAGGATSGQAYMPWSPGMGFSIQNPPVYMGSFASNIKNVIPENSSIKESEGDLAAARSGMTTAQAAQKREDDLKRERNSYLISQGLTPSF